MKDSHNKMREIGPNETIDEGTDISKLSYKGLSFAQKRKLAKLKRLDKKWKKLNRRGSHGQ